MAPFTVKLPLKLMSEASSSMTESVRLVAMTSGLSLVPVIVRTRFSTFDVASPSLMEMGYVIVTTSPC